MRLGLDFGTTNSSISYFNGRELIPIRVDPNNENPFILPSLIFFDRDQNVIVGSRAAEEYLRLETGRTVKLENIYTGNIEVIVSSPGSSPIRYEQDVFSAVDVNAKARLIQSIKTGLRSNYKGTDVFGRFYKIEELISLILIKLKKAAEDQLGEKCNEVVLGRPVIFSSDIDTDYMAEEKLYRAAKLAGFEDIKFGLEPIGAAYLFHVEAPSRQNALVFDFGGGTLDMTLAELGGNEKPKIIATKGVLIGGDDLDSEIMRMLNRHFGEGETIDKRLPVPAMIFNLLSHWQTMPELSRPSYMETIRRAQKYGSNPEAMTNLEILVTKNLGYDLFRKIEKAKRQLSNKYETFLQYSYEQLQIFEKLLRSRFQDQISDEIYDVDEGIKEMLNESPLRPSQVDVVLRTGGSSAIPIFVSLLEKYFGNGKIQEIDPFISVVGGLAVMAYEGSGSLPKCLPKFVQLSEPLLSNLKIQTDENFELYELETAAKCYTDREFTFSKVPYMMQGMTAIRISNGDRKSSSSDYMSFDLSHLARIYICYDYQANEIPEWLRSFDKEDFRLTITEPGRKGRSATLIVYSRDFEPGHIVLGGNSAKGFQGDVTVQYVCVIQALPQ